ncbi:hypothetical protein F53441_1488 [Fusarium austroafricanum]|uniref:NACHT domain-containing protein n=1 Tax=Fusarium austroafricanum TaxID=2364996 RepID=A0A8H4NYV7_9HYPO|nr:hypothetical protein F53441_1488 [Fusarium austroafricanum]
MPGLLPKVARSDIARFNDLDMPLDDVVVVDRLAIADYNESDILPQDEATLKNLRDWIRPTKYEGDGSELKKHTSSYLEGTSQWLLDSPIFQQWHDGRDDGILWIRGVPGTGKSVLASRLIHHLSSEGCPVLYFFFRHTIQSNHRPESALRDWLAQALPFSPPLQLALLNLTSEPIDLDFVDDLSLVELWHLVRLALNTMPKAYCVVDALDEMDSNTLEHFLQLIDQLEIMHPDRVKLIITSRPIATIEKIVRNLRLLDIRLDKKVINPDISTYLQHRLVSFNLPSETKDAIKKAVLEKADGLFLYAKLTMDKIAGLEYEPETEILQTLERMPVNLSVMYGHLLREHMDRTGLPKGLNILVLQLVTHATRPLRLLEISDCIKMTQPQYGQDTGTTKNHVRTCCGPLLEVLPDETVRVVHHSLTEYLFGLTRSSADEDIPVFEPDSTHDLIANLCLSYLQTGYLDNMSFVEDNSVFRRTALAKQEFPPFMNYAVNNWHTHTKKATRRHFPQEKTNEKIFSLLMTPGSVGRLTALASQTHTRSRDPGYAGVQDEKMSVETEVLLFSVGLGLTNFIESFLERCGEEAVNYSGSQLIQPPLHRAVHKGKLEIIQLLLKHGAELDQHNYQGDTPLDLALGSQIHGRKVPPQPVIVENLLKAGADPWKIRGRSKRRSHVSMRPDEPYTPTRTAFSTCDETIAKLFIPYIETTDAANKALSWVLEGSRNIKVMRQILDLGLVDINACADGPTLLFLACKHGDPKAASMLLEAGADPNICRLTKSRSGREIAGPNVMHALANVTETYLQGIVRPPADEAVRECFKLVLDAGVNVNHVNCEGDTPLHQVKTPLMAQLLLDGGADPNAMNCRGNLPLHIAHSFDVMKMIISKTDIDMKDREASTILLKMLNGKFGSSGDEISDALQLLDLGADVHIVDNEGNSVLHHLATHEKIASPENPMMLERVMHDGLDPNLRNKQGQTALHRLACQRSYSGKPSVSSLRTFIELTKADINALDDKGQTPLFSALDKFAVSLEAMGNEFIPFMAEVGARFDDTDQRGRTLLHPAVRNCCGQRFEADADVLRLLIELGTDPQGIDAEGNTAWHEAVPQFSQWSVPLPLLQRITALGIDPKRANNQGRTPFHVVCDYNRLDPSKNTLFEYLLEQIGDINVKDFNGATALHTTATYSTDFTMRLLEAGADATMATNEGLNVFHLAARCRQSNTIGLLLEWLTVNTNEEEIHQLLNLKDKRGRAPLYYACAAGSYQSVDLLISAGAVVEMETYNGSALNGCADYVKDDMNWRSSSDADSGGVLVDDTRRPMHSYSQGRMQKTLDLVINNAAAPNWRLLDIAIAAVAEIATATDLQFGEKHGSVIHPDHDTIVECFMRARKSLGIENELPCAAEARLCLERRERKLSKIYSRTSKFALDDDDCDRFSIRLRQLMISQSYDAIPEYINEASPKLEDLYKVLVNLVELGFTRLLDTILTPETISILQTTSETSIASLLRVTCKSKEPNMPLVRVLASKGVRLDDVKQPEGGFLHVLSRGGRHPWWHIGQALPYLLKQGVDLEIRDKDGLTPLNASLENMDKPGWSSKATELLLQAGADPNSVDDAGKSCLSRAVENKKVFKILVQHGATVDHSELSAAILTKDIDLVEMILAAGADPNGRTVPNLSSDEEKQRLQLGVYTLTSLNELYPLDLVISEIGRKSDSDTELCMRMVELLLKCGADPNARFYHTTIAHRTVNRKGSNPNTTYDTRSNFLDTLLLHPSLDVNLRDNAGVPLLHTALKVGDERAARILIKRGADVRLTDSFGRNVLHLSSSVFCSKSLFDDIVALAPEILHQADKDGKTPLHSSLGNRDQYGRLEKVREGIETFVDMLIAAGADTCAKTENGDTPLHLLFMRPWSLLIDEDCVEVWQGPVKIIMDLFLSNGADINARNEAGETPIFTYFREADLHVQITRAYFEKQKPDLAQGYGFKGTEHWIDLEKQAAMEKEPILWAVLDKAGVNWTAVDAKGQSLLHIVAGRKVHGVRRRRERQGLMRVARFRFLMGKGLDPVAEDGEHRTALDVAAANRADDIMELFKAE